MIDTEQIKGILLDYGGTIDTNGIHWSHVIWRAYQRAAINIPHTVFRDAYVFAERYLGTHEIIRSDFNFKAVLQHKIRLQLDYLVSNDFIARFPKNSQEIIVNDCLRFAQNTIAEAIPILSRLHKKYKIAVVSNFYGNISTVLHDFGLSHVVDCIVESATIGIRKPDVRIYEKSLRDLRLLPHQTVMIGDAYDKDIVPAKSIGCQTIWLKKSGWDATRHDNFDAADCVINDFKELIDIL